ncbi:MAG TPA: bifunctional YncE family protein/alkaline phosphatase family protein [Candidatus Angelobacter sp.]
MSCTLAFPQQPSRQSLPTGMEITPLAVPGSTFQPLNPDLEDLPQFTADHPLTSALSPDGKTLLVLTSGFNRNSDLQVKAIPALSNEYVFVFDLGQGKPVKRQVLKIANSYAGLVWAPDGARFFVSGGPDDNVHLFEKQGEQWKEADAPIALGHKAPLGHVGAEEGMTANRPLAAGVAASADGSRLLAANSANDSVSLIDLGNRQIAELDLRPGRGTPGGTYPYWAVFQGSDKAYVSSLRDREIVVLDLSGAPKVAARIKVHGQPGKMLLNKAQTLLFAVCDNSDSVVIVDTRSNRVMAEIKTTAPPGMLQETNKKTGFKGANPNSLALSPDERTLYVTNGGLNSVAVIALQKDPDDSRVEGLLPTAWYPTSVTVSADGGMLFVTNAKSVPGPNPRACRNDFATSGDRPCATTGQYVLQLEKGGLTAMPRQAASTLAALTRQVAINNHFVRGGDEKKTQALFAELHKRIKHVIYIVKENRTYDQVLGDLEKGNGDPKLTLFPEPIAPNHHELARSFVTLDNFYDSGGVSGTGWNWSTAARATDLVERTIPLNYAKRGVGYDVEGMNRGINLAGSTPEERNTADLSDPANQLPGTADVAAPDGPKEDETGAGYLWDAALRAKVSLRNYGFFLDLGRYSSAPGRQALPLLQDPSANETRVAFPTKTSLQEVTDPYFRGFDMRFADYWRFTEWEREFDQYVNDENLPQLELLRICHDHLGSFDKAADGVDTVETQFADNDYALGLVAEKVAHSPYAKDTLIFVLEDDAQNGPDHVDAHRSIAYVIGPYVKQGALVSERYTTVSLLRTIEQVLGIKPLGINDAFQRPMSEVFDLRQKEWTYMARVPEILRRTRLPLPRARAVKTIRAQQAAPLSAHDAAYWTEKTRGVDFSEEDKLDTEAFNQVLWNGLKGDQPYPSERDGRDLRKGRRKLLRSYARKGRQ